MSKPVINFEGYKVTNIDYKSFGDLEEMTDYLEELNIDKIEDRANLEVGIGLSDDQSVGNVKLINSLIETKRLRMMTVEIVGQFGINTDNPRKYLSENGSAILFPYLRAVTSMVTSLDNENAIILPTFNFSDAYRTDEEVEQNHD